jgi:signal transduction histidine kinase
MTTLFVFYPSAMAGAYNYFFIIFLASSTVMTYDLFTSKNRTEFVTSLGVLSAAWTLFQARDMYVLWFSEKSYLGPYIIAVLTSFLTYFRHKEIVRMEDEAERLSRDLEVNKAIASFATQIAHDIRAPLALLSTLKGSPLLPDEIQSTLSLSTIRLGGIADQLLDKNRHNKKEPSHQSSSTFYPSNENRVKTRIDTILAAMIQENRAIAANKKMINFKLVFSDRADSTCVDIQPTEFTRILSNILSNAVEAIESSGDISIQVSLNDRIMAICITDSGNGIPADVVAKLGTKGTSFGKLNGNGLGLYHAKKTLEHWGGSLRIQSYPGSGTSVTLLIPIAE